MPLLAWSSIERHFGTHEVLRGLSGAVEKGQKVALVGPNGCGKTTLLKIIAGADKADTGTVSLEYAVAPGVAAPATKRRRRSGSRPDDSGSGFRESIPGVVRDRLVKRRRAPSPA